MKNIECSFMRDVVRATKSNQWTDELRSHAATCSDCQQTMAMTSMMNELVTVDDPHPLPHFRTIWLKSRYAKKQERLTKFDLFALAAVSLSGLGGLVALLYWIFPQLFGGFLAIPVFANLHFPNLASLGTPTLVLIGLAITVWLLTRDSIFAEL
jgi:hypothetical protein